MPRRGVEDRAPRPGNRIWAVVQPHRGGRGLLARPPRRRSWRAGAAARPRAASARGLRATGGLAPERRSAAPEPLIVAASYGAPAPPVAASPCRPELRQRRRRAPGRARARSAARAWRSVREVLFLARPRRAGRRRRWRRARPAAARCVARVPRTAAQRAGRGRAAPTARAPPRRGRRCRRRRSRPCRRRASSTPRCRAARSSSTPGAAAALSYVLGGAEPATVEIELVRVADGAVVDALDGRTASCRACRDRQVGRDGPRQGAARGPVPVPGESPPPGVTARAPPRAAGVVAGAAAPSRRARRRTTFTFLRHRFPLVGAHEYGDGRGAPSAAAAAIRARTSSRPAARRSSRRAAGRWRSSSSTRARATTSSSTARAPASTTPTCTCATPRSSTRATASATGQLIGYVGDDRPRVRLPPALRDVDGAGLVPGRRAVRPAPGAAGLGRAVLSAR